MDWKPVAELVPEEGEYLLWTPTGAVHFRNAWLEESKHGPAKWTIMSAITGFRATHFVRITPP